MVNFTAACVRRLITPDGRTFLGLRCSISLSVRRPDDDNCGRRPTVRSHGRHDDAAVPCGTIVATPRYTRLRDFAKLS